ncbi:MAG: DJ-1/PfpI family protein [Phenylobacterium sp.]
MLFDAHRAGQTFFRSREMSRAANIVFVAYDDMTLLDFVGPFEVLTLWPDCVVKVAAAKAGVVSPDSRALPVLAPWSLAEIGDADLVIVPGGPGPEPLKARRDIIAWLAEIAPRTQHIVSICTGAFLLGEAGLLKGLKATTHWSVLAQLSSVGAEPVAARWVDEGRIVTAAGVSAGIDTALWLTAKLRGEALAKAIQLMIEYDPAPPFDTGAVSKAGPDVLASLALPGAPALVERSFRTARG